MFLHENVGEPIAIEKGFSPALQYDNCEGRICNHGVDSRICFLECKISFLWLCGYRSVTGSKTLSIIRDAIALEGFEWTKEHEIRVLYWL